MTKHKSKLVQNFLEDTKIKVLALLSPSPDLSPTENLWSELKVKVDEQKPFGQAGKIHNGGMAYDPWKKHVPTWLEPTQGYCQFWVRKVKLVIIDRQRANNFGHLIFAFYDFKSVHQ